MASLPTREIHMAPGDVADLLAMAIHVSFTSSKPEETPRFAELDFQSVLSIFESEKDTLEGILTYESNKGCCYVLSFHDIYNKSLLESRLGLYPKGEIPLTIKSEEKEETVFYKLRMIPLASLEKTNKDLYDSLSTNLIEAVTTGKPSGADVIWNSQPGFQRTSTPQPVNPFSQFLETLQQSPNDYIIQLRRAIAQEARIRGLILDPITTEPTPTPTEKSIIDHEELGKTLARCNQDFLAEIMTKGLLKTTPPKLHPFSGEQLREDVPYEQWEYEVKKALQSHTEKSVCEAMVQCLKGPTLEGVRSLGEDASVTDILNYLKGLFQGAAPFDTLLQNCFQLKQEESERVAKFAVRLESHLATLKWQYPEGLAPGYELTLKRDRLFYGLHKDIRDSIRPAYQNSKIPFTDLLRAAREIEEELGIPSQTDTDFTTKQSKGKAKVASAVAPGLESTANLQKLAAAGQKCHEEQMKAQETLRDSHKLMNDLIATLAAFKSPTFHFNPSEGQGRRGRGGFNRGRGNGRGGSNGRGRGQNQNEHNNQSNPPSNGNGQNDQAQASGGVPRRQPFCFYCKQQGAERSDHWPNRCQLLAHALKEYHDTQSRTGHTDHQGNTSGQH